MIFLRCCQGKLVSLVLWQRVPSLHHEYISKNLKKIVSNTVDFHNQCLSFNYFNWFSNYRSQRRIILNGPDWFSHSFLHFPHCSAALGRPSDCREIQYVGRMIFDTSAISPQLSLVCITNLDHIYLLQYSEQVPEYCAGPEELLSADELQYAPLYSPTERAAKQPEGPTQTLVPAQDPLM